MLRRSWRCMNSRSRKPAVAMKATPAPLRSSTALVATVEPCPRSSMRARSMPEAVSASKAPTSGLRGVLGTLVTITRPFSTATRSVKVPPTSTPTRMRSAAFDFAGEGFDLLPQLLVLLARLGGHRLHGFELVASWDVHAVEDLGDLVAHARRHLVLDAGQRAHGAVGHLGDIVDEGIARLHGNLLVRGVSSMGRAPRSGNRPA